jgi:ABC-type multidrug transport system fused ATPase/permease subunit
MDCEELMKNQILSFIDKKLLFKLLLTLSLQQMLIALGTYSLITAGLNLNEPKLLISWAIVAFITYLASPFFSIPQKGLENEISFNAYSRFLDQKLFRYKGKATLSIQNNLKGTFLASIGSETESYLGAIIYVATDLYAYILSIILGTIVVGLTLDRRFLIGYIVSAIFSYVVFRYFSKDVSAGFEEEQKYRVDLSNIILSSWDNIFFNNSKIHKNYETRYKENLKLANAASVSAAKRSELMVAVLSFVSTLPVIAIGLFLLIDGMADAAFVSGIMISIPRQLNLLATFRSIYQAMNSSMAFYSKFEILNNGCELKNENLDHRIDPSKFSLTQVAVAKGEYAASHAQGNTQVENLMSQKNGRWLLSGPNGSGKSTKLLQLNEVLENSFYLPAHANMDLGAEHTIVGSTGQRIIKHLEQLAADGPSIILLDEWDANLDSENCARINEMINEIAMSRLVIEVRH